MHSFGDELPQFLSFLHKSDESLAEFGLRLGQGVRREANEEEVSEEEGEEEKEEEEEEEEGEEEDEKKEEEGNKGKKFGGENSRLLFHNKVVYVRKQG